MSVKELFGLQAAYEARNGVKPELKCCPFCGEPGEVHTWTPLGKPMQRYGCAPCNVFKTTAEAWNRRAQPAEEMQKDAERWRRWLPWMRNLNKVPFDLVKEIAAIDSAKKDTP